MGLRVRNQGLDLEGLGALREEAHELLAQDLLQLVCLLHLHGVRAGNVECRAYGLGPSRV